MTSCHYSQTDSWQNYFSKDLNIYQINPGLFETSWTKSKDGDYFCLNIINLKNKKVIERACRKELIHSDNWDFVQVFAPSSFKKEDIKKDFGGSGVQLGSNQRLTRILRDFSFMTGRSATISGDPKKLNQKSTHHFVGGGYLEVIQRLEEQGIKVRVHPDYIRFVVK